MTGAETHLQRAEQAEAEYKHLLAIEAAAWEFWAVAPGDEEFWEAYRQFGATLEAMGVEMRRHTDREK